MIRAATREDAEAIDRVHVRAWEHAYADFISPERMKSARPIEERLPRWRERMQHPEIRTWVYEVDGFVAGFASAGGGELLALYVEPAAQGAGVGSALLAHAEDFLRAQGSAEATLWVFVENEHGRRFYEARAWRCVEGSEQQLDWAAPGIRYRKAL